MPPLDGNLRLTELLASLSLATDLGTGQPLGHGLRTCLLAARLGREMELDPDTVRSIHQVTLLRFLGCTADAAETARAMGGDEVSFNAAMAPVLNGSSAESMRRLVAAVGPEEPPVRRARLVAAVLADPGGAARSLAAHCEVASMLSDRLGLGERVRTALEAAYERWDGKGHPTGLRAEAIPIEIRIAAVARDADLWYRRGEDVMGMMMRRRGKAYDPEVVDALGDLGERSAEADWSEVLAAEPEPVSHVQDLDQALTVMADFVDLKSPWMRGHSRSVAELAGAAGREAGLDAETAATLGRAGLVHDLGRVGVENGIWDKAGPLSLDEWEKVRLHPYLTHRILSRCPALAPLGVVASSHHERLDGSGYHRQASADDLGVETRLLAAADALAALTADRPHRKPLELKDAVDVIRREAKTDRLDGEAVECVVAAAGGRREHRSIPHPGGLTDREVEVLQLLTRGMTNRQVGDQLFISAKTVGRHVENIYLKIGVSTRAGAAVYAMQHRLID